MCIAVSQKSSVPLFCDRMLSLLFFFFNDTATTEIYTLSLHDALPICELRWAYCNHKATYFASYLTGGDCVPDDQKYVARSEERFSRNAETDLVCRLLLEKKKSHKRKSSWSEYVPLPRP